jgi:hypothetical protein
MTKTLGSLKLGNTLLFTEKFISGLIETLDISLSLLNLNKIFEIPGKLFGYIEVIGNVSHINEVVLQDCRENVTVIAMRISS